MKLFVAGLSLKMVSVAALENLALREQEMGKCHEDHQQALGGIGCPVKSVSSSTDPACEPAGVQTSTVSDLSPLLPIIPTIKI